MTNKSAEAKAAARAGEKGCILRVEKASIFDGPGLRSVVFFKGCPMRCAWCSTPESQSFAPEVGVDLSKCAGCGKCAAACSFGALRIAGGVPLINRALCVGCFACAEACPERAIKKYGGMMSVRELADEVSKDEIFYFHTGGGVTLSGGEPCAQSAFASKLLRELKMHGTHTMIETALFVPWKNILEMLPHLDCMFVDIKHMDSTQHALWTGVGNELILTNLKKIDQSEYPVLLTIRVPLIPGVNDGDQNLAALAEYSRGLSRKLRAIELLPYHRLGHATYALLDMPYELESASAQTWEELEERAGFLASRRPGTAVLAGGHRF